MKMSPNQLIDGLIKLGSRMNSEDMEFLAEVAENIRNIDAIDRSFGAGVPGLIAEECYALRDLLIAKNKAYGNAALEPVRIFSKASTEEQLLVRIDDKLSRLVRGSDAGEDVVQDLLGYLVLLRIARRLKPEGE